MEVGVNIISVSHPGATAVILSTWNDTVDKKHMWVFFGVLKNLIYLLRTWHRLFFIMNLC